MDFKLKCLIYIKLISIFMAIRCFSYCVLDLHGPCASTINCIHRPTAMESVPCIDLPNVTFVIKQSDQDILTSGFFSATNFDRKVKYIKAIDNVWHTIESNAFKYFINTGSLNLTDNGIVEINNEAFVPLERLQYLDLSHNKIERLNHLSLRMGPETVLQTLDLSNNKLMYLQDYVFSSLKNLQILYLEDNRLTSLDDDCFSELKSLVILFLNNNNLSSLNSTLISLRKLKYINLANNKMKILTAAETRFLNSLIYLNISYNTLEAIEPNTFSVMQDLKIVDFSHNQIVSVVDSIMFMNNHELNTLDMSHNKITTLKKFAFQITPLIFLNIDYNSLSINISRNTMKGLHNLKYLNITNQNITAVEEKAFVDMQLLRHLNLSHNNIKTVDNTSFEFINESNLNILDLSYNSLRNLYFMQNFSSNLTELYINNNKLTIITRDIFINHENIIRLDLSENEIIAIEQNSLPLLKLQYLNINKNNLMGNITTNIFSPAPLIRYLNINNFAYQGIDENAFEDLTLLTKLNLSNNQIKFIHFNNFKNMEKMYSLDLSHNNLSDFEIANYLDLLSAIYINDNKITRIPKLFSKKSQIVYIDVSNNNFSDIENAGFENVSNVRVLKMAHNDIKYFNNNQTNKLIKLSDLNLSSNKIVEIKLNYFKELISLDLSNNSISHVNSSTFENLQSLQYLDLSFNNISAITPGTFQHLKILKYLNLSSNLLSILRYGTFRGLSKTEMLDISRNKISFLDVNIFHNCDALKKLIIDYNFIKTVNVDGLLFIVPNLMSLSIGGNPILCEEIVRNVRLKESKKLEITSIHKIYHDDNVHGIKCGNASDGSPTEGSQAKTTVTDTNENKEGTTKSSITVLMTWCSIITILAISAAVYLLYKKRNKIRIATGEPPAYRRNSLNISCNEYSNDLLN